ncbi:hypothetical protein BST61_g2900 [Cercospora zeina]
MSAHRRHKHGLFPVLKKSQRRRRSFLSIIWRVQKPLKVLFEARLIIARVVGVPRTAHRVQTAGFCARRSAFLIDPNHIQLHQVYTSRPLLHTASDSLLLEMAVPSITDD